MQFRLTDLFGNLVGYWEVPTEKDKKPVSGIHRLVEPDGNLRPDCYARAEDLYGRFFYAIE